MYYKGSIQPRLKEKTMISIRTTKAEEAVYKDLAKFHGISVSALIRQTMNEMIEDYYDVKDAEEAYKEYLADPVTLSHDEFWEGLV